VLGLATPELSFYEEFTATENLVFAGETRGLASPARAAAEALERVGLSARADDRVSAYSSGMKQRLRIAFALLHQPPLLLLDEPGSHLDDAGRDVVRAVVAQQASRGLVLLATNDAQEVQLAAARLELRGNGLGDPS
jgi:heme exporter protein A